MNLLRLSNRQQIGNKAHLSLPRTPNISLSTKLILLVVGPLALTLAVTLPLTVTGLNRLASETSSQRLEEEIGVIGEQFADLENRLNQSADEIAKNPNLLSAVREADTAKIASNLLSISLVSDLQHLGVVDIKGVALGHEHQADSRFDERETTAMNALGLLEIETTTVMQVPQGWFLMAIRPLKDSVGLVGSVSVGRMIDVEALAEMNFNRLDPLVLVFNEFGKVATSSIDADQISSTFSIVPDSELVEVARTGQVVLGSVIVGGMKQRAAYSPVVLGGGSRGVFAVVLTTSPVVSLRDELIANYVMVTAALVLLVLGVGYVVTRTITQRILRLRDTAVEIGNGNLLVRVEETINDEMGTLAHEFNRMADSLNEKNTQLELANRNLEMRVFERTDELEQANARLVEAHSQLVRTEKLAAIGELSNGVAHDLRSPLGAIRNGVFFLKARLTKSNKLTTDPKIAEFLEVMDNRITHCDKIIGDLIAFTHIGPPEYAPVNLAQALDSAIWIIGTPSGLTIVKELGDEEVEVQADHNQLVKVFSSLAVNAQEAMPEGGVLTISLKKTESTAELTFADNGMGMDSAELDKIFDPLYTTKIQGTGLGLAVCQQIIAKHNGRLDVSSQRDVGTTFTVVLPLIVGYTVAAESQVSEARP